MHWIYLILPILLTLQCGSCIKFFVQWKGMACTLDYPNQAWNQVGRKTCITVRDDTKVDYEYHFTQQYVYAVEEDSYAIKRLKGSPFNTLSETLNNYTYSLYGNIVDFAVDWVHKTVYVIVDKVLSGSMVKSDHDIALDTVMSKDDAYRIFGIKGKPINSVLPFDSVKIDPYNKLLFVVMRNPLSDVENTIFRSDLKGSGLTMVLNKTTADAFNFCLDINAEKLFVSVSNTLYMHDYNGQLLKQFTLPYSTTSMYVFENNVYMTTPEDTNGIFEISLNQTKSPLLVTKVYRHEFERDVSVRLLDARSQRKRVDGKYICDRTDCPEHCEVESTGDICVCFHTKAKARDGVMCYECGQSNLTSLLQQPTIVDGTSSYTGNFPWHAIIYKTSNLQHSCGGTLISSQVVLTAAHCVTLSCIACTPPVLRPDELVVALGKTNRSWHVEEPYETRRNVTKIIVKENYLGASTNYANDIALLVLDSKVPSNGYVMPACLDFNLNQLPYHGSLTGYVCGFGYTKECGRRCSNYSETLLHTTGSTIKLNECLDALNKRDKSTFHGLAADKFCMGNGTVSPVQNGDSGGGFTLAYHGLHYVTGVVSVKLVKYNGPSVKYSFSGFTNVSVHMDWIRRHLILDN